MTSPPDRSITTFECHGLDGDGQNARYVIMADQTLRPRYEAGFVVGHHLEWQFYCEELKLVLVRKSEREFVAIDDPTRVFRAIGDGADGFR